MHQHGNGGLFPDHRYQRIAGFDMPETRNGIDKDRGRHLGIRGHDPCQTVGFGISIFDFLWGWKGSN